MTVLDEHITLAPTVTRDLQERASARRFPPRSMLRRSMSRTGSCLDNTVAEAWFPSLEVELVDQAHHRTRAQARAEVFGWIAWYNRSRVHSTRGYLPPIEWEQQQATINPLPSTTAA
jgi:putative transposase